MTKASLLITAMFLGAAAAQAETKTSLTRIEIDTHIDIRGSSIRCGLD